MRTIQEKGHGSVLTPTSSETAALLAMKSLNTVEGAYLSSLKRVSNGFNIDRFS